MNVETLRKLFAYHYDMYGQVWDCIMHLSEEQFVQELDYSIGSIRNHMVHLLNVDQRWVARLRGEALPEFSPDALNSRAAVRAEWDKAVDQITSYVTNLTEAEAGRMVEFHFDMVYKSTVWAVLLHITNHGTDHRSQIFRLLHDLGAPTMEHELLDYFWTAE